MSIGCVVQARSTSTRFPGKVCHEVAGKPLLGYLTERLSRCRLLDDVVVATSVEASDDVVAALAERLGVACVRGPLDDVATRFLTAVDARGLDAVVRVCADSPLLDPALVDHAVALFGDGRADLVTNVHPRTFPAGESVEVLGVDVLRRTVPLMDAEDREHVTRYFYRHAEDYDIRAFAHDPDLSAIRLTVDTPKDMARFEALVARMTKPQVSYGLDELLELISAEEVA